MGVVVAVMRILFGWLFGIFIACSALIWVVIISWPSSWWIQVAEIRVFDSAYSQPVQMAVNRTIRRDFTGSYSVSVLRQSDGGWVAVSPYCDRTSGLLRYTTNDTLPPPNDLTLSWWVGDGCTKLPAGVYQVVTIWTINRDGLPSVTTEPYYSNIFEIMAE